MEAIAPIIGRFGSWTVWGATPIYALFQVSPYEDTRTREIRRPCRP